MIIYRTADGKLWTEDGLARTVCRDVKESWDEPTQGPYDFNVNDWKIEAINTGVITEVFVED